MYLCFMDSPHQVGSLRILSEDWRGWSSVVYSCLRSGLRLLSSTCLSRSPFLLPAPPELLQPSDTQTRTTPQDWKPTSDSCTFPCSPLVFYILFLGFKLKVCTQRVTHKTPISALNWKDTTAKNSSSCPGSSKATYIYQLSKHTTEVWEDPDELNQNCTAKTWSAVSLAVGDHAVRGSSLSGLKINSMLCPYPQGAPHTLGPSPSAGGCSVGDTDCPPGPFKDYKERQEEKRLVS